MRFELINYSLYVLLITLPISIIIGPSVSLINLVILDLIFIFCIFNNNLKNFFNNKTVIALIILYFYLIFNTLISVDYSIGIFRNLGFIRFILLFIAINYLFFEKNYEKIFYFWLILIIILTIDVFIEFIFGRNILGYGEGFGRRLVSFFKDEPVIGAFLSSFYFIITGYLISNLKRDGNLKNILKLIFLMILFVAILLTGERANFLKVFIGTIIFFFFYKDINLKKKILFIIFSLILVLFVYSQSSYLKHRYYSQFIGPVFFKDFKTYGATSNITNSSEFFKKNIYIKLYKSGFEIFKSKPFFGVGNKNYRVVACKTENSKKYTCNTHPHQIYFELLSEHGIVGTIIIISIIFYLLFKLIRVVFTSDNYLQKGCFIFVILTFLPLIPSGSFFGDFTSTLFWINFSLMFACNKQTNIFYEQNKKSNTT